MESRRRRKRKQVLKWCCYALLLLLCSVLQTTPGLLQFGQAKPCFILPLCLAVAVFEGEFAGALFGAVGGLMWDYTAGRTAGLIALSLMCACFALAIVTRLYLKNTAVNFALISAAVTAAMLSSDHLFYYVMPGYSNALERYLNHVPLSALMTALLALPLYWAVQRINSEFKVDDGVV